MQCHYEVLGVPRDVTDDELRKAYRKLALRYHPDKNLSDLENAKKQFLIVQQAYEVLSDPHERAWYDAHREAILRGGVGGDYKDDSLDVMMYFTASCFRGYNDDDKGFYSVYREVFNKIAAEDIEYMSEGDSDFEIPGFGDSQSPYDTIVHPFYAYWQSYSTKKSYSWLDPYDTRDAENRRVLRLIEKENKKIRDKARKQRNEEVRNLVAFVNKRDKRVHAHAKLLQERAAINVKKAEEARRKALKERHEAMKNYEESDWSKFSNIEKELEDIEASLVAEFGENEESVDSENESESEYFSGNNLYCVACNKVFKTEKAFANHENSKKHRENVEMLKSTLEVEDDSLVEMNNLLTSEETGILEHSTYNKEKGRENGTEKHSSRLGEMEEEINFGDENGENSDTASDFEDEVVIEKSKKKHKKPNTAKWLEEDVSDVDLSGSQSRRQRRRRPTRTTSEASPLEVSNKEGEEVVPDAIVHVPDGGVESNATKRKCRKSKDQKSKTGASVQNCDDGRKAVNEKVDGGKSKLKKSKDVPRKCKAKGDSVADIEHCCVTCRCEFPSKNKLFEHLKSTGHSVYIPGVTQVPGKSTESGRKGKDIRTKEFKL